MTKCSTSGSAVVRAHLALILATAWGAWGCDLGRDGNGERVEETRELAAFSRVRSNSELDVQVVQGAEQALSINLDSNLIDLVRTRVSDDTLYIETREDIGEMVHGPHVRITLPAITAAKLAGSGSIKLAFDEPELPLDLYLSGSGSMRFEGKAAAIGAFLSGSGDIRLAGEASDARLGLSGSGSIDGRHLATESADIDLSGSGDVSAHAQSSVRVRAHRLRQHRHLRWRRGRNLRHVRQRRNRRPLAEARHAKGDKSRRLLASSSSSRGTR